MTVNTCWLWGSYYGLYLCDVMSDTYEWVYTDSRILSHNQHSFLLHHSHYLHISGRQLQYSLQSVLKRRRQLLYQPFYTPHLLSVCHKTIKCTQAYHTVVHENEDATVQKEQWFFGQLNYWSITFTCGQLSNSSHQNLPLGSNVQSSNKI